jgi:hypothetical protein
LLLSYFLLPLFHDRLLHQGLLLQTRVTLIGRPDCHLCDEARKTITNVCNELNVGWEELSILDNPKLADQYFELIPVTLVDGLPHDQWKVDPDRLRKALS